MVLPLPGHPMEKALFATTWLQRAAALLLLSGLRGQDTGAQGSGQVWARRPV